jgi:hypothetical protein
VFEVEGFSVVCGACGRGRIQWWFMHGSGRLPMQSDRVSSKQVLRPWSVPREMEAWVEKHIVNGKEDRGVPLVLIGAAGTGKSEWAARVGCRPLVVPGENVYKGNASHIVLNDIDFSASPGWCELLGYYSSRRRLRRVQRRGWGVMGRLPVIVTCNADLDPQRVRGLSTLLKSAGCVFVEITEKLF